MLPFLWKDNCVLNYSYVIINYQISHIKLAEIIKSNKINNIPKVQDLFFKFLRYVKDKYFNKKVGKYHPILIR